MSKANTRATIDANIKQNGVQAITGQILNSVLNAIVTDYAEETATDERITDIEQELGFSPSVVDNYTIGAERQTINFSTGVRQTYPTCNILNPIRLLKGEILDVFCELYTGCAVISLTSRPSDLYASMTPKVEGQGSDSKRHYRYTATEDCNVVVSYMVADGLEIKKYPVPVLDSIQQRIETAETDIVGVGNRIDNLVERESLYMGNYPLLNGGLNLNGTIFANADRMTTGVVANNNPLHVMVNAPYQVAYVYGNNKTSLNDGGYLISGLNGGEADVARDAKYVGFTILKPSVGTFDNLRLMIYPKDANEGKILSVIDSNQAETRKIMNRFLYENYSDVSQTKEAAANVTYNNIIDMPLSAGDVILVKIDASQSTFLARGLAVTTSYSSTAIGYAYGDRWTEIVIPQDTTSIGISLYQSLVVADNVTFHVKKKNVALLQKKMNQLTNSVTISNSKELIAISDAFDINSFGKLCAGMVAADNAVGEYGSPIWKGYLLIANLADLEGTKSQILCYQNGNMDGVGYIEVIQHGMAKWTGDDEITTIFQPTYRPYIDGVIDNDFQYSSFIVRKYTPSNNTWGEPIVADINVKGTTYKLETKWDISGGGRTFTPEQISEITAIWSATGIEHPSRSDEDLYQYQFGNNFFLYNNEWYAVIGLGSMSHTLCKSSDLIHWTFVCDIPFGQISLEEACVCIYKGKVYAMSRGENQLDGKDSRILVCSFSSLSQTSQDWSTPVVLAGCHRERPTIAALNDRLYIMQGTGESVVTEGKSIARARKKLYVMDVNLNVIKEDVLEFTYPLLHPQFMSYGGNLFMCTSSDKRCLAWTKGGDTRSEISVAHLDEKILSL